MDIDIRNKVLVALAEFGSSERGCIIPPIIFISFNIEAVLSIK